MLVLGGTGPVDANHRRPWIDWIHTANVQGTAVRDFVKWDDQPASAGGGGRVAGPRLQPDRLGAEGPGLRLLRHGYAGTEARPVVRVAGLHGLSRAVPAGARPARSTKRRACWSKHSDPVILANMLGRAEEPTSGLLRLAESARGARSDRRRPVTASRRATPLRDQVKNELLAEADVVVAFDVYDLEQMLTRQNWQTRINEDILRPDARLVDVSLRHLTMKSWADDHGALYPTALSVAADTALALPSLADAVEARLRGGEGSSDEIEARRGRLTEASARAAGRVATHARDKSGEHPLHLAIAAGELWEVVKDTDWVIGNGDLRGWVDRLWDFTSPHQQQDTRGGAGLGQGLSHAIGVALANRDKGRLTINVQSDGDLLFTPAAIWTAVHHRIPMLIVMYNNRTYGNDLGHQAMMARTRGRPEENKTVGIDINDPVVDFVGMARSFGAWAEGPIERAEDLRPALELAKREVVEHGRVALVDLYTQIA